jgi:FkbM family methyltransferase
MGARCRFDKGTVTILEKHLANDRVRLVDVGARGGVDPRWARFAPVLEVTAFEPDPAECQRLSRRADALPYAARFLPYALWRESGVEVNFHVCNWPVASSIYPPNRRFLRAFPQAQELLEVREIRSITTARLDDMRGQEGLNADCLKIDVEGAELDVLVGGESTLRETLVLEVEVELNPVFADQPLFADVDRHLRERGWELLGLRRNSWRRSNELDPAATGNGGQIVSADALYWNGEAVSNELGPHMELKLLIILAAYLQADLIMARLRTSNALTSELSADDLAELETVLVPRPGPMRRLARRALRRLDAEHRRALADALQQGDATVWHDPHFF